MLKGTKNYRIQNRIAIVLFVIFQEAKSNPYFSWEKFPFKYHAAVLLSVSGVRLRHIAGDTIDEIPKRSTKNVS